MTREEKQKAIDTLKMSVPIKALTQEEFNDYIQTLNKIMNWLEQDSICETTLTSGYVQEINLSSVTPDMLDKIRAEIEQTAKDYDKFDDYRRVRGLWIALEIIDKYKSESME